MVTQWPSDFNFTTYIKMYRLKRMCYFVLICSWNLMSLKSLLEIWTVISCSQTWERFKSASVELWFWSFGLTTSRVVLINDIHLFALLCAKLSFKTMSLWFTLLPFYPKRAQSCNRPGSEWNKSMFSHMRWWMNALLLSCRDLI